MTVAVFLETKTHAEQIATFTSEEIYSACLPALELFAANCGGFITESIEQTSEAQQ